MKLLHAADLHLGRRRLEGRLPDTDFRDAFSRLAEIAVREGVDAVLLAGDLFDQPQVEPTHLRHAQEVLLRLQAARIPVLAIEGNHDKGYLNTTQPTWLDYLADDDLIRLLTTRFDAEGALLTPWDPVRRRGSWLELDGFRFVGAGYLGAATPHKIRQILERLEPGHCHVLLLHAGPDYFVGESGGFSRADLAALRERVCYLALGHIHKPMIHGGWACNPGSPENCDLQEARYDHDAAGHPIPRGYALVTLDPASPRQPTALTLHTLPRRPVREVALDCTPFGNKLKDGVPALVQAAVTAIRTASAEPESAVLLHLRGRLNLRRIALDPECVTREIETRAGVTAVALDLTQLNVGPDLAAPGGDHAGDGPTREELERQSIRALVEDEHLWGLDGEAAAIAGLFFELKEMVRTNRLATDIAERVNRDSLVDLIQLRLGSAPAPAADPGTDASPPDGPESSAAVVAPVDGGTA